MPPSRTISPPPGRAATPSPAEPAAGPYADLLCVLRRELDEPPELVPCDGYTPMGGPGRARPVAGDVAGWLD